MRALLILLIACSHSSSSPTVDASPTSVELACESHGTTFPQLEKACTAATDCFVALHTVSCCGTQVAIGFNLSSKSAFTTAENKCDNAYPGCGCAEGPTMAEDGKSQQVGGAIDVRCDSGLCRTYVP